MRSKTLVLLAALAACGGGSSSTDDAGNNNGDDGGNNPPADAPTVAPYCTPRSGTAIKLEEIANGLNGPLLVTSPPGDTRLFIVEQPGRIKIYDGSSVLDTPFLDIRDRVDSVENEQGLLGLAFHPQYAQNGRFFVYYTAGGPRGDTVVAEYAVSAGDRNVANKDSERRLMAGGRVQQPATNHNGGMLAFGPDGFLYIGLGDGGGANDFYEHGQNINTLLAAILRIDVNSGDPYGVPPSNPFVGAAGEDEIWVYGLRNPWRFSFDRSTGDMYIGDVGQGEREEIDVVPAGTSGLNFGWSVFEGTNCFNGPCGDTAPFTMPITEYSHAGEGCSVTGGYVYRGACLPDYQGRYFFSDYCDGLVRTLRYSGGQATDEQDITSELDPSGLLYLGVTSFGEDAFGELYITHSSGRVYRIVHE